ncbi:hypothetical protein MRGA327_15455 [Mycobacterium tuberculosis RGTB327]|nr:hypothetical protein MRGA327_15455 [Mycobacterium tuberculosis RGTB327]
MAGPLTPAAGADVLQSHRQESSFGKQSFGGCQELESSVGLQLTATICGLGLAGPTVRGGRCHDGLRTRLMLDTSVNRH